MAKKYRFTVRDCLISCTKQVGDSWIISPTFIPMLQETVSEKWKPEGYYYSIGTSGQIVEMDWVGNKTNYWDYKTGNCFPYTKKGKKQAEEYREKLISLGGK